MVVCSGTFAASETWANVFHVSAEVGDFTEADAVTIMELFEDYYQSVASARSAIWRLTQITARDIREPFQPTFSLDPTPVVGGSAIAMVPPQVAMVVTLRTGLNSRRGRGRTYLNGFLNTAINSANGQFVGSVVSTQASLFLDLCVDLDNNDSPLLVSSRTDQLSRKVTAISVDSRPDTQRGRVKDLIPATVTTLNVP